MLCNVMVYIKAVVVLYLISTSCHLNISDAVTTCSMNTLFKKKKEMLFRITQPHYFTLLCLIQKYTI